MADGLLGGIGDFFTGGGVYADPKNINQAYGVPEGDVRNAALNQLSQMSALLLAAGQPMEGSQRAQYLSQLGGTGAGFNTALYNSAQRRLMNAQMGEKQKDIEELNAIRDMQQKDPEGFAKRIGGGVTAEMIKTFSPTDLRDVAKQVTIKKATQSPLEQMTQQRVAQLISGAATGGVPAVGGAPAAGMAPADGTAAPAMGQGYTPDMIRSLATDPILAAANPELAKKYADLAAAAEPAGNKEAQILKAKTEAGKVEAMPKLEQSIASRSLTTKNLLNTIEEAKSLVGSTTAGYGANLSGVQGTDAANLAAKLQTITANIGFEQLQKMRDESPTGGALGQVAVQELEALQSVLGSLKQGQSPAILKEQLDRMSVTLRNFEKVRMNAFEREYKRKPDIAAFTAGTEQGGGVGGTTSGGLSWSIK